jgi:hypothetical protein
MNDLLKLAIDAHGGLERWRAVRRLDVGVSLTGALFRFKGQPQGLTDVVMSIDPHRPDVVVTPYGGAGRRGRFTPDRVWIEDTAGRVLDERNHPLTSFAGHTLETPWDQLHLLYFVSYAMWNYLTTPFLFTLPGFETQELSPHTENGDVWRRLQVKFPRDIPTHNGFQPGGEQTFYFNGNGLLQRLDYTAVGPASHYTFDHATFGGLSFPTLRRVVRRLPTGPRVNDFTAVLLRISNIDVK